MTVFGTTQDGKQVKVVTLQAGDLTVRILTLGAILQDVRLAGVNHGLTPGSDNLAEYEHKGPGKYNGAIVGPIANRIGNARVRLDGMMYELERNEDGVRHLHSGRQGSHAQHWTIEQQSASSVTLSLAMPDGMAGLPGNRQITAHFKITPPATLTLSITGVSDATTLLNFANHSYWNLDGSDTWHGHQLAIAADNYLPIDAGTCPIGEIADVSGTSMDFRNGPVLDENTPALDHNFCLSDRPMALRDVLWLTGQNGVSMTIATTEPGMQVFDDRPKFHALAIEPQHWPDAPNNPDFPTIKVQAGETYRQITSWTFRS